MNEKEIQEMIDDAVELDNAYTNWSCECSCLCECCKRLGSAVTKLLIVIDDATNLAVSQS